MIKIILNINIRFMSESSNLKTPPNKRNKENDLSIALDALNCLPDR